MENIYKKKFSDRIKLVQEFPIISPNKLYDIFFNFEPDDERYDDCQYRFLITYFPRIFELHFSKFEPLDSEKNRNDIEHYPYLELTN